MPSPFKELKAEVTKYDEWGGQFSCMEPGCWGRAKIAKYFPSERKLIWLCDEAQHQSVLEDVDE